MSSGLLSGSLRTLLSRENTTTASSPTKLFSSTSQAPARTGIRIINHDANNDLWFRLVNAGAGAPAVSAANNDGTIPPGGAALVKVAASMEVYILHADSAAHAYSAMELE